MSTNVYQMVTDRIIAELEKGLIPWERPWSGVKDGAYNRVTGKPYSLLNQMLLQHSGEYATFKQITDAGGHVKKGAKSEMVCFWKMQPVKEEQDDGTTIIKQIPLLRYYNVFHVATQCEGIEPKPIATDLNDTQPIESADDVFYDYINRENIKLVQVATNEAYYSPAADMIHLPLLEQFQRPEEWYSTAFHEATHSTMKESRCNRKEERKGKLVAFNSEERSKEEIIAEIGASTILNALGIETDHSFRNSAAYIQNWLTVLRNDNHFIVSAASKAEKAVSYILNK